MQRASKHSANACLDLDALIDPGGLPDVRLNPRPVVHGVQTALVTGQADDRQDDSQSGPQAIHTDRDGRIRIQFHWQRGSQASAAAGASPAHHLGQDNAPANEQCGAWVHVMQPQAGANWGAVFTPRIGQEVLVAFEQGDIDRPIVIGALYNGQGQPQAQGKLIPSGNAGASGNAPAWFASDGNINPNPQQPQGHRHDAVLLGYKSQQLDTSATGTGGYNHLVVDNTPGQARAELASSADAHMHQASRLQLGHLLHQDDNQRLKPQAARPRSGGGYAALGRHPRWLGPAHQRSGAARLAPKRQRPVAGARRTQAVGPQSTTAAHPGIQRPAASGTHQPRARTRKKFTRKSACSFTNPDRHGN